MQQGVDVGEQENDGRVPARGGAGVTDHVVHAPTAAGSRAAVAGAGARRTGPDGGRGFCARGRLPDPLGSGDEHLEPWRAAEPGEQLGTAEGQLEPLDEAPGGVGVADEVVDVERGLGIGAVGRRRTDVLPAAAGVQRGLQQVAILRCDWSWLPCCDAPPAAGRGKADHSATTRACVIAGS